MYLHLIARQISYEALDGKKKGPIVRYAPQGNYDSIKPSDIIPTTSNTKENISFAHYGAQPHECTSNYQLT